jgi:UDP-glucose 4-epimerase
MILVAGGMGFIGLHTARSFLGAGEHVVLTQYRARREPEFIRDDLGKRAFVEQLDVAREADVLEVVRKHRVSGIVHLVVPALAALSPGDDYRVNTASLLSVLEAARQCEVKRVTLASSIAVYAGLPDGPYHETDRLPVESGNPTETYKKAWEIMGLHYADRTGVEVISLRLGGIYGPLYHTMANIPSRMCHAAAHGVAPDFSSARHGVPMADDRTDSCYVKDCARGIQLVQMAERLEHRVYNIGGGRAVSYAELAEAVKKAVPTFEVELQPGAGPRAKQQPYMDISRIKQELGYEPEYDLERGVADYIEWLRSNPE